MNHGTAPFRIAVFHDNFAQAGGAEKVAEEIHRTLAPADLWSTLYAPERLSAYASQQGIRTTWMQSLPGKAKYFRYYFLLYPFAVEGAKLDAYDLIVTSCFGYAKGVRKRKGAVHVCYCHTPMRWVWRTADYVAREGFSAWKRTLLNLLLKPLKAWEMRAARQPDIFIANSHAVAERIRFAFGRESIVIPPPIETSRFQLSAEVDDSYLVLTRLTPYKRIDLAVEACTRLGRKLVVIGDGPDRARLEAMAGPTVTFLGRAPDEVVNRHASRCRALLFPGEEDFGMVPLEINASGRPVIAFYGGGAMETVLDGETGVFFREANADSLSEAILRFESMTFNPQRIRSHAEGYDTTVFRRRLLDVVRSASKEFAQLSPDPIPALEIPELAAAGSGKAGRP